MFNEKINYIPIKIFDPKDIPTKMFFLTPEGPILFNPKKVRFLIVENTQAEEISVSFIVEIHGINKDISSLWVDNIVTGNSEIRMGNKEEITTAYRQIIERIESEKVTILYEGVRLNVAEFS